MREIRLGVPYPFEYRALNGCDAVCEIRVFQHNNKTIVVVIDVDVGPSVTNNVEQMATLLRRSGIEWDAFCEHYFDRLDHEREETFDWVMFTWEGERAVKPDWKPGSRQQLEALIGRAFV
jgi:hypothetical protein